MEVSHKVGNNREGNQRKGVGLLLVCEAEPTWREPTHPHHLQVHLIRYPTCTVRTCIFSAAEDEKRAEIQ